MSKTPMKTRTMMTGLALVAAATTGLSSQIFEDFSDTAVDTAVSDIVSAGATWSGENASVSATETVSGKGLKMENGSVLVTPSATYGGVVTIESRIQDALVSDVDPEVDSEVQLALYINKASDAASPVLKAYVRTSVDGTAAWTALSGADNITTATWSRLRTVIDYGNNGVVHVYVDDVELTAGTGVSLYTADSSKTAATAAGYLGSGTLDYILISQYSAAADKTGAEKADFAAIAEALKGSAPADGLSYADAYVVGYTLQDILSNESNVPLALRALISKDADGNPVVTPSKQADGRVYTVYGATSSGGEWTTVDTDHPASGFKYFKVSVAY